MEENFVVSSNQTRKHQKGQEKGKGMVDSSINLCDLPDPILEHIISFLPTKDAVRTSFLSKRWERLCLPISSIELKEQEVAPDKRKNFIDFVKRVLVLCDSQELKKISLTCEVGEDACLVHAWILAFVKHKIEELSLVLNKVKHPLLLPDGLFSCGTLTKLLLNMNHLLRLPSFIYFEKLSILTLEDITFPDAPSTQLLFSGCPSLEELSLIGCRWLNFSDVQISFPVLKKLYISEFEEDGYPDELNEGNDDIADGRHIPDCCVIMIVADNLESFTYSGFVINNYYLCSANSVTDVSVKVDMNDYVEEAEVGFFVFNLIKEIENVKRLSLCCYSIKAFCYTKDLFEHLPVFHNLAELRVGSESGVELYCEGLWIILRNSPYLVVVDFETGVFLGTDEDEDEYEDEEDDNMLDPVPPCFSSCLRTINVDFKAWWSGNGIYGEECAEATGSAEEFWVLLTIMEAETILGGDQLSFSELECHSSLF
ncbi:hypothetical protein L6164_035865 [Bauhinia variegata]|uniref:Uncharacterized protein n=1 Tax=Bauhinia variegata TaxID=167791 RepID=A0ACB9KFE4_BAUVA|nr:hypothetical protein L6164_035865 [Bauhinia variegata]